VTAGASGRIEDSSAAAVSFHLECPATADLHRNAGQARIEKVDVVLEFRHGWEAVKPFGHRGLQLAWQDPAHLKASGSFYGQPLRQMRPHLELAA
jgi:hypothetical protein